MDPIPVSLMCTTQLSSYEINRDQQSLAGNSDCFRKEDSVPALAQLMRSSKGGGGVMNEEAPKTQFVQNQSVERASDFVCSTWPYPDPAAIDKEGF